MRSSSIVYSLFVRIGQQSACNAMAMHELQDLSSVFGPGRWGSSTVFSWKFLCTCILWKIHFIFSRIKCYFVIPVTKVTIWTVMYHLSMWSRRVSKIVLFWNRLGESCNCFIWFLQVSGFVMNAVVRWTSTFQKRWVLIPNLWTEVRGNLYTSKHYVRWCRWFLDEAPSPPMLQPANESPVPFVDKFFHPPPSV